MVSAEYGVRGLISAKTGFEDQVCKKLCGIG